jgi:hypothetical protein
LAIAQPFSPTGQLPDSSSPNAELATPTPQAVPVFDMNAPEPKGAPAAAAQANLAPQPPVAPMPAVAKPAEAQLAQVLSTAQPAPDNSQISTGLKPALAQVLSTAQPAPDNSQISTGLKPAAASPMNPPEPAPIASQPSIAVPTKVQDPAIKNQTIDKTAQIQGHDKVQGQVHVQGQGQVHVQVQVQVQVQGKPETQPVQPSSELAGPQTPDQPVSPAKPVSSAQTTIPADKPDNTNSLAALDSIESELESVVSVAQAPKTPSAPIAPTDKPNTAVAPTQAPPPASPALPDQILPKNAVQTAQQDQAEGGPAQTAATPLGTPIKGAETLNPSASPSQPPTRSAPAHSSSEPAPSVVAANASASPGANSQSNSDQAASDSPTDPSVFGGSIKQSELSPAGTQAEAAETPTIAPIAQSNAGPTTGASVQVAANAQTVSHLASEIVRKSDGKSAQFDISLMPEGLGKVDVQISINQRGEVTASMVFDTPQAAAELRGRAAELQKSLEQSGFQVSQGGLSFTDTSGQGFSAAQQQAQQDDRRAAAQNRSFVAANDAADTVDLAAAKAYATNTSRNIDVRI